MELNRKLTRLLKGRTIKCESGDEGHVVITFDDESTLKLRAAGQATPVRSLAESGPQGSDSPRQASFSYSRPTKIRIDWRSTPRRMMLSDAA